ncbi:TPA: hypothetical protein HA239_01560 [Candidatus Woesearchaeota archaeon]|nr:hypothetical protein [Candidatus Woesearchaeota archaeon]HIH41080.1 hypothetical protein [Candidatus Woesearchaeota archaeon]
MEILIPIAGIITLFFILLIVKRFFDICVICGAISLTWISLLVLYKLNMFDNPLIVAMLMGQSVVGIYYLVDSKVKEELKIFRLPFLLTLTTAGISLISVSNDIIRVVILVSAVWAVFILIYLYRSGKNMKKFVSRLIECCKKW